MQKSSSQLGLHPKSTFANNRSSPLQDSVNFQKSPSLSPSPISSHHNLPKSRSTATLNQQRKPQRVPEATLSHQNSRRSLGATPQSYSLLMDYINECKVNNQSPDNSFEHKEHLFSSRRVITENRVVDPEILQLIMNGETEKIFKENRNSLKENSPQTPGVPLIRKKSNERESNKPISSGLANREISPVEKKAKKSTSKRPMSYNETTMRELLKLTSCSSPQKSTQPGSENKLGNDPPKKVPIFFFNIPEDPADVQKTLTTEDNAAPTFNLRQSPTPAQKTKKRTSPGKKRSDLTIVSNAMKQYEMFMEGEYNMSQESKRRSSPAKSQNSELHSVEVSTISREDSLRTGITERDEFRYTHETAERLLSELLTDHSPALQTSPNDFHHNPSRRISSFNPQHSQNDPRKSPHQPKVITRVSSHSQIKNANERVNSAARTRNSEFSFEMTYFKPIEDSKLDEYIQSVNGSRGQTTTTSVVNSPESSPPKYQPGSIENYQELEKTLSYWQNLCKDITKTPSKPEIKMKMGPQNPVIDLRAPKPTRSISNQKPRPPAPTIKAASTMAKNMVKQTITHQLNLSPLSKTPSKTRINESKSPLTRKNSRDRSTSIESKKVYENKSVVVNTRPSSKSAITRPAQLKKEEERTYFKLDQLLQVIKTNNNTGTTKDNSRSNSETTSEIGLFQQNTFRSKDIVYVNLTPSKRVYGKNLISNGGTNR